MVLVLTTLQTEILILDYIVMENLGVEVNMFGNQELYMKEILKMEKKVVKEDGRKKMEII